MQTVELLLSELRRLGVKLSLEDGQLRCRAPSGTLSDVLLSQMREMREEIIRALEGATVMAQPGLEPLVAMKRPSVIPLSATQNRLWLLDRLGLGGSAYNIGVTILLEGRADEQAIQAALDALVSRHEPLRTRLIDIGGEGAQIIDPPGQVPLAVVDLAGSVDGETDSRRLADAETTRPFDLARGPLFRALLIRISPSFARLVLTVHHVVSDGWSVLRILFPEFIEFYAATVEGRQTHLPTLDVQYADFALWQRKYLQGPVVDRQLQYWQSRLDGAPSSLDLPSDRPRESVQSSRGARVPVAVPIEVLAGLKTLAAAGGATLFMVMLAAWSALLARWSGQSDIVIGTPVAGRNPVQTEPLMGFFINTLPLRVQLQPACSFRTLLNEAKSATLGAFAHQDVPFDRIVDALHLVRHSARQPLVQALLVLHNEAQQESAYGAGLKFALEESDNGGAQCEVALHLYETPDGLQGWLHFETDLFDAETATRMAAQLTILLELVTAAPDQPIASLDVMTAAERQRMLVDWNRTGADLADVPDCVHMRIAHRADQFPAATAVAFDGRALSYRELDERANRLARHLRARGVVPDTVVAIFLHRSLNMTVAILGVLKAGGAYLPLDPELPTDRLEYMLQDAAASLVIRDVSTADLPIPGAVTVVDLDRDWADIAQHKASALTDKTVPSNLAYVIYTSGSTGRPKGVKVEHAALSNRLLWMQAQYKISTDDVVLQKTPYSFDVSVWEFLWTLSEGARLEVAKPRGHLNPAYLGEIIRDRGVTVAHFVPSMLAAFVSSGELSRCDGLRLVFASGEALPHGLAQEFLQASQAELHNLYGPTEAAIDVTYHHVTQQSGRPIPIGRPIWNTQLYIFDEAGALVPQGLRGELHIAGQGLARGYCGSDVLTAERFVETEVCGRPVRMYRTGDIVRWRNDGELEYLGRCDNQVKLRGFRIELGEIEAHLSAHPDVRESAVALREDTPGDKRLVAYFTSSRALSATVLREHLESSLPDYMVPAAFVWLDRFPLTANGKLDRRALPQPDNMALASAAFVAPVGAVETALAEIWSDVLGVESVGRNDNFFALGGHSLLALEILQRARSIGWQIEVERFFEARDLAELAADIVAIKADDTIPPNLIKDGQNHITPDMLTLVELDQLEIDRIVDMVQGGAANIQDIYPLTPLQEGIFFHHLMEEQGDTYLMWSLLSVPDHDMAIRHVAALEAVMKRHDALRTSVAWEGLRSPVQIVWRDAPLIIEELEFDPADGDIASQLVERFNPRQFRIDLRQAPLVRVFVAQDPVEDRCLLLVLVHHLIDDATSLRLLMAELRQFLEGAAELPTPVPFRNFVARARSVDKEEQSAFFRTMLSGIAEPTAPYGILDIHTSAADVSESRIEISLDLARRARAASRTVRVSTASLFHAACANVIGRLAGRDEALFGTVLLGRMYGGAGVDRVMGAFINTLPIKIALGDTSVADCVQLTHSALAALMRHESASLAFAQRFSAIPAPAPLFTAIVNYRRGVLDTDGGPVDDQNSPQEIRNEERTNYPLALICDDSDDRLVLSVQARAPINPNQVVEMVQCALAGIVAALEDSSDLPMAAVDCLPPHHSAQLLTSRPQTADADEDGRIHELFEDWAVRQPDAIALIFEKQRLTYGDLNAQANRLARFLIKSGVHADSKVAICTSRSPWMIVAVIAVLKAGAAYVPMEPAHPTERLAYMLDDAAPVMVLTDLATAPKIRDALSNSSSIDLVCLDADSQTWSHLSATNPERRGSKHDVAYMIYTSGSTGLPKGVMIEHCSLFRLFTATQSCFDYDETDIWTMFHSLAFDFSIWEMWGALAQGGRLVLVSLDCARAPDAFYQLLCDEGVTILNQTPSAFMSLMNVQADSERVHAIRTVNLGGEKLLPHLLCSWVARNPLEQTRIINIYGITETTVFTTWLQISETDLRDPQSSRIGVPFPHLQVYILDQTGQLAPIGVTGEIYVGGEGLARGYHNRPELTEQRFVSIPACADVRLYRSGDLGRIGMNGELEYLGRCDEQIKLRGFRIELGEIEACLSAYSDVGESVVLLREDTPGDKRLVAYFTSNQPVDAVLLREHLEARLPDYMVPLAFVRVERFALTPNGKIDRKALHPPDDAALVTTTYVAPAGVIETAVAEIWRDVLGVDIVGRNDNFFALGGDSMLAVQATLRARRYLAAFTVSDLFEHPTVADVCVAAIAREAATETGSQKRSAPRIDREVPNAEFDEDAYALTTMQEIMFREYEAALESGRGVYHAQFWLTIRQPDCSAVAMEQAAQALIVARPVLRTRIILDRPGEPVQVIRKSEHARVDFRKHDLTMHLPNEQERMIDEAILQDRHETLHTDDDRGLVRFIWFQCQKDKFVLLISIHHAIDDGWGNQYLLADLFDSYTRIMDGKQPALLTSANVFKEFVEIENAERCSAEASAFWRSRKLVKSGMATLNVPQSQSCSSHGTITSIRTGMVERLYNSVRTLDLSGKALALSAYLALIETKIGRVCPKTVGVVANGRSDQLSDPMTALGLFWNLVPLCVPIEGRSAIDHARAVHLELTDVEAFATYPLPQIEADHGGEAVFFSTFNFLNLHHANRANSNDTMELLSNDVHDKWHYPLNLVLSIDRPRNQVTATMRFDPPWFTDSMVEQLLEDYFDLLEQRLHP